MVSSIVSSGLCSPFLDDVPELSKERDRCGSYLQFLDYHPCILRSRSACAWNKYAFLTCVILIGITSASCLVCDALLCQGSTHDFVETSKAFFAKLQRPLFEDMSYASLDNLSAAGLQRPIGLLPTSRFIDIWLIRHGEKPTSGPNLDVRGWARAAFLKELVADGRWPQFQAVFASSPYKPPFVKREMQTVQPLAHYLGTEVNITFGQNEGLALANHVRALVLSLVCAQTMETELQPILIAWEHCRFPFLLSALGCDNDVCARCWADNCFDRVVRLRMLRKDCGTVDNVPRLLPLTAEKFLDANTAESRSESCQWSTSLNLQTI